jgi:nucleoside-diphosphate-sugar epimerase
MANHILIAGASGVVGSGAVEQFATVPHWHVTAVSRRRPVVSAKCRFDHVAIDLTDSTACVQEIGALAPVTHLIYAAVAEAPGLIAGWRDERLIALNGEMFSNLLDPVATRRLRHVSLLQGTKAYGAHHHAVAVPCREDEKRDEHPNFYWLQEDHLRLRAAEWGFGFTIFRPQVVLGAAPGVAMNPVAAIGAYAVLTRELGRPFVYPGGTSSSLELVDTALLSEAFAWAAGTPAANGVTFNITNGDVFAPSDAWQRLGDLLGLPTEGAPPPSLAAFFDEQQVQTAWHAVVARHSLAIPDLSAFLGQSARYVDLLWSRRESEKAIPVLLSTVKIRQTGFAGCRDSFQSLVYWLNRMSELRLLPPLIGPTG